MHGRTQPPCMVCCSRKTESPLVKRAPRNPGSPGPRSGWGALGQWGSCTLVGWSADSAEFVSSVCNLIRHALQERILHTYTCILYTSAACRRLDDAFKASRAVHSQEFSSFVMTAVSSRFEETATVSTAYLQAIHVRTRANAWPTTGTIRTLSSPRTCRVTLTFLARVCPHLQMMRGRWRVTAISNSTPSATMALPGFQECAMRVEPWRAKSSSSTSSTGLPTSREKSFRN